MFMYQSFPLVFLLKQAARSAKICPRRSSKFILFINKASHKQRKNICMCHSFMLLLSANQDARSSRSRCHFARLHFAHVRILWLPVPKSSQIALLMWSFSQARVEMLIQDRLRMHRSRLHVERIVVYTQLLGGSCKPAG